MRLVILDDYKLASDWAAKYIKKRINQFEPNSKKYFTLGLPTGKNFFAIFIVSIIKIIFN